MNDEQKKEELPKKAWVVLNAVPTRSLEAELNTLCTQGYQVFRVAPLEHLDAGTWIVIAFDPARVAEIHTRALTAMLAGQAGVDPEILRGMTATTMGQATK